MKPPLSLNLKTQYIVDKKGNKTGVILDIKLFEAIIEELEDLYDITQAEKIIDQNGKRYTLEEIEKALLPEK